MKDEKSITTWPDHESASLATAYLFLFLYQQSISRHGKFIVALAGGNTPQRLYQLLSSTYFKRNIDWDKVFFFWGDERFVARNDPESNYRMASLALLKKIRQKPGNVFPVPITGKPADAAREYEKSIRVFFGKEKARFDCILLGIGNDGHTASLFPGAAFPVNQHKLVTETWSEEKKNYRISFTFRLINAAHHIIFLVTGKEKAAILARIMNNRNKPALPAQLVQATRGCVFWVTDEAAAAKI